MKVAAIMAAMLAAPSAVQGQFVVNGHEGNTNWNAPADPCSELKSKACHGESKCDWKQGPRKVHLGRKETGGKHHSAPVGEGICAMKHLFDRVDLHSNAKKSMKEAGMSTEWDEFRCEEAFYLKDCKDINQHHEGEDGPKCGWSCENGCHDFDAATGETDRVFEDCREPTAWDSLPQVVREGAAECFWATKDTAETGADCPEGCSKWQTCIFPINGSYESYNEDYHTGTHSAACQAAREANPAHTNGDYDSSERVNSFHELATWDDGWGGHGNADLEVAAMIEETCLQDGSIIDDRFLMAAAVAEGGAQIPGYNCCMSPLYEPLCVSHGIPMCAA